MGFPQSGLFMCPCHGGAYYRDGSRASGPPERGFVRVSAQSRKRLITIQAGELPTPRTERRSSRKETAMRFLTQIGEWF